MKFSGLICYFLKVMAANDTAAEAETAKDYDGHNGFADHFQNGLSTIVQIARRKGNLVLELK